MWRCVHTYIVHGKEYKKIFGKHLRKAKNKTGEAEELEEGRGEGRGRRERKKEEKKKYKCDE